MKNIMSEILSFFGLGAVNSTANADYRRRHVRYPGHQVEVMVGNRVYSVRDWSMGGLVFETSPDSRMTSGDKIQVVLRFRFLHDTITVQQQAQVVRTTRRGIAAQFSDMSKEARRQFDRVMDTVNAQRFLESQVA